MPDAAVPLRQPLHRPTWERCFVFFFLFRSLRYLYNTHARTRRRESCIPTGHVDLIKSRLPSEINTHRSSKPNKKKEEKKPHVSGKSRGARHLPRRQAAVRRLSGLIQKGTFNMPVLFQSFNSTTSTWVTDGIKIIRVKEMCFQISQRC